MSGIFMGDVMTVEENAAKFFEENFIPGHSEMIGEILLHSLVLESHLMVLIQKTNPNLPDLKALRLGFDRVIKIALGLKSPFELPSDLHQPIKSLCKLRNALAHQHPLGEIQYDKFFEPLRSFLESKSKLKSFYLQKAELKKMTDPQVLIVFISYVAGMINAQIRHLDEKHERVAIANYMKKRNAKK